MTRLIAGNLDCDLEFQGARRLTPSRQVLATIAPLATLLRAFALEGDRLWTPGPVRPECMAEVPGLARPLLISVDRQSLDQLDPGSGLLAWAETGTVAKLRRRVRRPEGTGGSGLAERIWRLPPAEPRTVAELNHRGIALRLADALGCALPGAALLHDPAELDRHLEQGGAAASPTRRFVLKAPWSSSGRSRAIMSADELRQPGPGERVARLFAGHGELLFEPWMERSGDYGCAALATGDGVDLIGLHSQELDPRDGRFLGLLLESGGAPFSGLSAIERVTLEETARTVGTRLAERGYRGPFGLDAWRYVTAGGEQRFHPLGEINVRMTMGLVVHALVERLLEQGDRGDRGDRAAIRFRTGRPDEAPEPCGEIVELVHPGRSSAASGAWLEWRAS